MQIRHVPSCLRHQRYQCFGWKEDPGSMRIKALKQNKSLRFPTIRWNKSIIHKRRTNRNCTTDWTMNASPAIVIYCFLEIFILCVVHRPPYPILLISLVGLLHSWTAKTIPSKSCFEKPQKQVFFQKKLPFYFTKLGDKELSAYKSTQGKVGQLMLYMVWKNHAIIGTRE